jgi:hypothetical protein
MTVFMLIFKPVDDTMCAILLYDTGCLMLSASFLNKMRNAGRLVIECLAAMSPKYIF